MNVLAGPKNVGKSVVVDALPTFLTGHDEIFPRFDILTGIFRRKAIQLAILLSILSSGIFNLEDEADFIAALKLDGETMGAYIHVLYTDVDKTGRFKVRR
ncbi:TPA: hypothetical protein ACOVJB_005497 [Klebsiella oxytoca]